MGSTAKARSSQGLSYPRDYWNGGDGSDHSDNTGGHLREEGFHRQTSMRHIGVDGVAASSNGRQQGRSETLLQCCQRGAYCSVSGPSGNAGSTTRLAERSIDRDSDCGSREREEKKTWGSSMWCCSYSEARTIAPELPTGKPWRCSTATICRCQHILMAGGMPDSIVNGMQVK